MRDFIESQHFLHPAIAVGGDDQDPTRKVPRILHPKGDVVVELALGVVPHQLEATTQRPNAFEEITE